MLATFGLLVATAVILPEASEATLIRAPSVMAVVLFVPVCAAGVRRFHDLDRSGWHLLWGLIPFVPIVLYGWWTLPGTKGPNRFGPDPLA